MDSNSVYRKIYNFESYNDYPQSASNNAKRALEWADKNGWGSCGEATGKQRAKSVKKEEIVPVEREQHQSDFDTSQDHNLYDFIKSMDPSNAERNLVLFKKYRLQGYRVSTALERIRKVGELREFCNANNIPIELATRFINVYPNLEDANIFKFIPPEIVIGFFTDKVETYLKNFIDSGRSNLR